jgi:hypothetical protein
MIAISEPPAKVAFHVDRREGHVSLVKDISIIDPQGPDEKTLHGQMEIMQETRVVDDARIIDVGEADLYWSPKSHIKIPPFKGLLLKTETVHSLVLLIWQSVKGREMKVETG